MTGLLHFQLDGQISCELTILFIKKQTKTDIICNYNSKILGINYDEVSLIIKDYSLYSSVWIMFFIKRKL